MLKSNIVALVSNCNKEYLNTDNEIKELFHLLELDDENYSSIAWNPLKEVIFPGNTVVIKPNFVKESHLYKKNDWDYIITHPNVIKSVVEYVIIALQGKGKIIITDGPQTDSSFAKIIQITKLNDLTRLVKGTNISIEILDLRDEEHRTIDGVIVNREKLQGDPRGSTIFDLLDNSEFVDHKVSELGYFGAEFNKTETNDAHNGTNNKYKVSRSVIESDVFINIPKLKTHKKAGITCCLKNLVGINTFKNWLPHNTDGTPDIGGDQFPIKNKKSQLEIALMGRAKSIVSKLKFLGLPFVLLKKIGRTYFGDTEEVIRSGNWYGNDTIWRMILDLNKLLLYGNPDGTLRENQWINSKKYIGIVDGIIAGEGNGPMAPDRKETGILICGFNPVSIDAVCAKIMGFDYKKIPSIRKALETEKYKICNFTYDQITVKSSNPNFHNTVDMIENKNCMKFIPHFGWKNHIELT